MACFWYLWWTDWDSVMAALFGSKFLTIGLVMLVEWWVEVRRFRRSSPAGQTVG
jgi:hypothetical protein